MTYKKVSLMLMCFWAIEKISRIVRRGWGRVRAPKCIGKEINGREGNQERFKNNCSSESLGPGQLQ